jgi:hypothetical protein
VRRLQVELKIDESSGELFDGALLPSRRFFKRADAPPHTDLRHQARNRERKRNQKEEDGKRKHGFLNLEPGTWN